MMTKRVLLRTATLAFVLATIPLMPSAASIVGETVMHLQCSESGPESLPRRITLLQVFNDDSFTSAPYLAAEILATYPFRYDVDSGRAVATGTLIKADGTEISLPRLSGRRRFGDASKVKPLAVSIDRGDIIEWKIKLKSLPPLMGLGDCFFVQVGVACSETIPISSLSAVSFGVASKTP